MNSPTQKQREARWRNHRIFRLRGLWWNLGALDPDIAERARVLVDEQLVRLGAEPERIRFLKLQEELAGV